MNQPADLTQARAITYRRSAWIAEPPTLQVTCPGFAPVPAWDIPGTGYVEGRVSYSRTAAEDRYQMVGRIARGLVLKAEPLTAQVLENSRNC